MNLVWSSNTHDLAELRDGIQLLGANIDEVLLQEIAIPRTNKSNQLVLVLAEYIQLLVHSEHILYTIAQSLAWNCCMLRATE